MELGCEGAAGGHLGHNVRHGLDEAGVADDVVGSDIGHWLQESVVSSSSVKAFLAMHVLHWNWVHGRRRHGLAPHRSP